MPPLAEHSPEHAPLGWGLTVEGLGFFLCQAYFYEEEYQVCLLRLKAFVGALSGTWPLVDHSTEATTLES